jgi:hypothetical protein
VQETKKNYFDRSLWTELDDECAEKISGGFDFPAININVNTGIQTNIAVVIGNNAFISQYNSFGKK